MRRGDRIRTDVLGELQVELAGRIGPAARWNGPGYASDPPVSARL